jgi:hypothetical protein
MFRGSEIGAAAAAAAAGPHTQQLGDAAQVNLQSGVVGMPAPLGAEMVHPAGSNHHQHQQQQQESQKQRAERLLAQVDELQWQLLEGCNTPIPMPPDSAAAADAAAAAAAALPRTHQLDDAAHGNLWAGVQAAPGGGLGLSAGLSQQQQQQQQQEMQGLQEMAQHMRQSLQEVDAALAAAPRLPPKQQLKLQELALRQRLQTLHFWQVICEHHSQQPLAAELQRLLWQQEDLLKLPEFLPAADCLQAIEHLQQCRRLVLDRHQQILEQWQQLQGNVQEQQRLLNQQNRALRSAGVFQEQFHGDPFAFLLNRPPPPKQPLTFSLLFGGWMEVLEQDAKQQQQPAQPADQ